MNQFCGFRLSSVSIVVGWVNLMGAMLSTILLSVAFVYLDDVVKAVEEHFNESSGDAGLKTAVIIILCFYLTTSVASVIASALLIVGSIKERHLLLAPWLFNTYIVIVFNVLNFIYVTYVSIYRELEASAIIGNVITTGITLVIQCTMWNAILSHFKQLRANQDLQQRLLPTTAASQYTNYTAMPPTSQQ